MFKNCLRFGLVLLLASMAASAEAQVSQGGIRGIVSDETAGVLIGVTVEAESPARIGAPAVTVTNHMGLFRFEMIPTGIYTVTFTLPGFTTIRRENVDVPVGRTIQLNMTLPVAGAQETVTVTAESPVIDTVHANFSTNFEQELVVNIPTTRDAYFDVVTSVPGVKHTASSNITNFSIYGSNTDQNSFQYDGVDVSSVGSGGPWDYPNYDMIQEIEVLSVGASAEFTGFQGGVINIVTKSGSNRFSGGVGYYFVDDWMVGNNTPEEEFPPRTDYRRDLSYQIGGPIIKDRLWFFHSFEYIGQRGVPIGVELIPEVPHDWQAIPQFKITAQLTENDTLEGMYQNNLYDWANAPSRTRTVEATDHETGDNPVIAIRWAHVFSANTLLEVKGGGLPNINSRTDPVTDDFDTPGHYDWGTGMATVNNAGSWMAHQRKTQVSAALTHYADDFIKGSHDFKFGVQILRSFATSFWKYSGDVYYYDYYGEAYYAVYSESAAYGATVDSNAGFINDNWTLTDRLTLNLGLRFDHMKSGIPDLHQRDSALKNKTDVVFPGKGDVIDFKHFSPRLGFTLTLDEAAKTVAKASLGRYYGKLAAYWIDDQSTGNTPTFAFFYNEDTGKYDIPYWDYFPGINLGTDPNLKNQYTDTLFVGVEREIIPEVRLDVSFIYKKENDFVRVKDVAGEYEELPHVDEFEGQTQILPVFNRTSPSTQSQYWSTNRDDFKQNYKSLVVQANKRWSRGWTLNGAYQWQDARSTGGSSFTNQSRSGFGADPNDLTNAYGRARFDATHSVKLSTAFELPYGITTGIRYTYADGLPLYRQIRVGGLSQGGQNVVAETRGSYKLDTVHDLAIRLDKDFTIQENKRIRLAVDIFNVFNMANAIDARTNSSTAGEDFLQATEVPLPRRIQLAIRFQF